MDDLSKEYVISFYNRNLMMHGDRAEALRWTPKGQLCHYEALLDIAESIAGNNILDFGCGKGDFYGFLKERTIHVKYTGCDINENLITLAREKYPETVFRVVDIQNDSLSEDFDYIFLCGVFNLEVPGIDKDMRDILKRLFSHCRRALALNALSAHVPQKDFELHYISPEELLAFAIDELSPFVSLRHDRLPYDFTMFVYKDMNTPR